MTTKHRVLSLLMVLGMVSGCAVVDRTELEEIVLDHRCLPKQRTKNIEIGSIEQALKHKISISLEDGVMGRVALRVEYPRTIRKLPIQRIYLGQSNDKLIANDRSPEKAFGLAIFSIPRSELMKSKLNLEYYYQNYCTSVINYSLDFRNASRKES